MSAIVVFIIVDFLNLVNYNGLVSLPAEFAAIVQAYAVRAGLRNGISEQ